MILAKKISLIFFFLMATCTFLSAGQSLFDVKCPEIRPRFCTKEFRPVCAYRNIQCIRAPCPTHQTESNPCMACSDISVIGYKEGSCGFLEVRPLEIRP